MKLEIFTIWVVRYLQARCEQYCNICAGLALLELEVRGFAKVRLGALEVRRF